jgi:hypothetical protein
MYADATINEIFSTDNMAKAGKLSINNMQTTVYLNIDGKFAAISLPTEAQFAPANQILTGDFDHDGHTDILLLGNHSDNRLKIGSIDANYGCLLKGDGKGGFTYVNQPTSGLSVTADVKSAVEVNINNTLYLLIGVSDGPLQFYKE